MTISSGSGRDYHFIPLVELGPLNILGKRKCRLEGAAPNFNIIPKDSQLDVGAVVVSCIYKDLEFYRKGWYILHNYETEELQEDPPTALDLTKVG
jgi:hypothetical protein